MAMVFFRSWSLLLVFSLVKIKNFDTPVGFLLSYFKDCLHKSRSDPMNFAVCKHANDVITRLGRGIGNAGVNFRTPIFPVFTTSVSRVTKHNFRHLFYRAHG